MPEKKRILYIITQSNMGGAQKYVFDLAIGLDKESYEATVAAGGNDELFKRLEAAGIRTVRLKWMGREAINPLADLIGLWEIYRLIKNERPDIIHLNSSKAGFSGSIAGKLAGAKVAYTVHGAVFEAAFSWLARKLFLILEKFSARFKDKIICVSENDRRLWLKHNVASAEKLITIHNGIDLNIDFATKEEARRRLFKNTNSPQPPFAKGETKETYLVGSVGYFYPEKNYSALIKAASLISSLPFAKDKKILFALIGSGPLENSLKSQVLSYKSQDKILFLGAIPETWLYLKAFDLFALPSIKEGLPYTILEAMAAGVPIVASNVGGIPEMIKDGENGFLVQPNDHEALAEKILQILENPGLAQRFINNSLEKVKEFSLERMIRQTQQQY